MKMQKTPDLIIEEALKVLRKKLMIHQIIQFQLYLLYATHILVNHDMKKFTISIQLI